MKKILISGCQGKMGHVVAACIKERSDCTVIAGVDPFTGTALEFPVFASFNECDLLPDVIVDFSNPAALDDILAFAEKHSTAVVLATTGYNEAQKEKIMEYAKKIPLFFSFNMSMGVNLLASLAQKAAAFLGDQFDIEIIEKHHNRKIDAPSGTALMLADAINETMGNTEQYVFDRHSVRKKREKNEIGISSVRGGTIVGEHEVIFAGRDEVITLSHSAMSRDIFAVGAVNAAVFLAEKGPGLYNMNDLL